MGSSGFLPVKGTNVGGTERFRSLHELLQARISFSKKSLFSIVISYRCLFKATGL
jgi:hypothetical protein